MLSVIIVNVMAPFNWLAVQGIWKLLCTRVGEVLSLKKDQIQPTILKDLLTQIKQVYNLRIVYKRVTHN